MQTDLRGRDLITTQEWTKEEIETLLDVAWDLKRKRALGEPHPYLRDKVLAMLFFFTSTRTRASFEAGMAQLGGHAQFIDSSTTQISHGDTAKEIGETVFDCKNPVSCAMTLSQLSLAQLQNLGGFLYNLRVTGPRVIIPQISTFGCCTEKTIPHYVVMNAAIGSTEQDM